MKEHTDSTNKPTFIILISWKGRGGGRIFPLKKKEGKIGFCNKRLFLQAVGAKTLCFDIKLPLVPLINKHSRAEKEEYS